MPYIERKKRIGARRRPQTAGELNYAITMLLQEYLRYKGEAYQTYNDILGALEGCKLETYRKLIAKYEDLKCEQNGEVF